MATISPSRQSAGPPLPTSISTPLVPVLTHPALVTGALGPNHLPSLAALLQPFSSSFSAAGGGSATGGSGSSQLAARALNLQTVPLPGFGLRLVDFDPWLAEMPAEGGGREGDVGDALGTALGHLGSEGKEGDAWSRMTALMDRSRPEVGWETFGHPLAMIIAIPSTLSDPLVELSTLFTRSRAKERFAARPWQSEELLRFIVVVHDVGSPYGSIESAQRTLENIKKTYGPHCSLLAINSLSPALPPSPFLHDTFASMPPADPVRALLEPTPRGAAEVDGRRTSLRVVEEDDGPLGEEGIESGVRLTDAVGDESAPPASFGDKGREDERLFGGRLTEQDVLAIRVFLKEFAGGSLIPYMERMISAYNEVFNSTRKGITGRLFGAGRKLWGGGDSRPSSPGLGGHGYNPIRGFYPHQTPEATNRRLADLAFILRDYRYAASIYDGIRKDYVGDKASMYVAGASEMLGLSLLLSSTSPPVATPGAPLMAAQLPLVESYFDSALSTYTASPLPQLSSVRMTLAYTALYTTASLPRPAAQALVRAAGEAEEVWAAVLLEEAANVEGRVEKLGKGGRGRERRQAGNWVEAAKRFEVCGLKSFSTRNLEKALVIYRATTWTQAQFFVEHALGRQAYTMGHSDVAVEHFVRLLALGEGQSGGWLDDFELAFQHLTTHHPENVSSLPSELSKPLFNVKRTTIRTSRAASTPQGSDPGWTALETDLLHSGTFGGGKKPSRLLQKEENVVSVEEPFHVVLEVANPLNTQVKLGKMTVEGDWSDASEGQLDVETIDEIVLEPGETREVPLRVVAFVSQKSFTVTTATFLFHNLLPVRQSLVRRGARLHTTKAQRLTPTYANDTSLTVQVRAKRPVLGLQADALPERMVQGETRRVTLVLRNDGGAPAKGVEVLASGGAIVRVLGVEGEAGPSKKPIYAPRPSSSLPTWAMPNHLVSAEPVSILSEGGEIAPGGQVTLDLLVHAPMPGDMDTLLLFAYQDNASTPTTFCTPFAHWTTVAPILEVFANHRPSAAKAGEHVIALEYTALGEVEVAGVQMISAGWAARSPTGLTRLPAMHHEGESQRSYLQLSARESVASMGFTAKKLHQLLSGTLDTTTAPAPVEVLTSPSAAGGSAGNDAVDLANPLLQPLLLAQLAALRRAALSAQCPLIPPASLAPIFPLLAPRSIALVIFFNLPSSGVQGHLVIGGLEPGPAESIFEDALGQADSGKLQGRSLFEQTTKDKLALAASVLDGPLGREDDPVRLEVEVETEGGEQFACDLSKGPALVPVTYTLFNTSPRLPARVALHLLPSPSFFHAGPTALTPTRLAPGGSVQLRTAACVAREGRVDVEGAWRCVVETLSAAGDGEEGEGDNHVRRRFERERMDEGDGRVVHVVAAHPSAVTN